MTDECVLYIPYWFHAISNAKKSNQCDAFSVTLFIYELGIANKRRRKTFFDKVVASQQINELCRPYTSRKRKMCLQNICVLLRPFDWNATSLSSSIIIIHSDRENKQWNTKEKAKIENIIEKQKWNGRKQIKPTQLLQVNWMRHFS